MRSLGLDPSLTGFGWAIHDSGAQPNRRRVASGHEETLPEHVPVARFMHFRSLVQDVLRRFEVDVVGIESPAYGGGPFSETHFGLMMFSLEAIFEARKDCVMFDPTTVKLLTTGKSNAGKFEMQKAVQIDTMDPSSIDGNEADAYCVARFSARFMELVRGSIQADELSKQERHVFLDRKKRRKDASGGTSTVRSAHLFRENRRFFAFSKVPEGNVCLPNKSRIRPELLQWLEAGSGQGRIQGDR